MHHVISGSRLAGTVTLAALLCSAVPAMAGDHDRFDHRSPLRGTWSFSQIVPSTTLLTGSPVPLVAVGTLRIDADTHFDGRGYFNTPVAGQQFLELSLNGHCTPRDASVNNGVDCVFNFPEFGLSNIRRFCVVMSNDRGRCFDEFRCVNVDEPGETVALIEFKRQASGTCR